MTSEQAQRVIEAALLCAGRPLRMAELCALFDDEVGADTVRGLLDALAEDYRDKGVALECREDGWRVCNRQDMQPYLDRLHPQRAPRYSKAVIETLAVIAFRQPVTRADLEEVRGVGVSPAVLQQLMDRGWVEVIGYRAAPGKPELFATTTRFLDDLKLDSLNDLMDGFDLSLPDKEPTRWFDVASTIPLADPPPGTEPRDWEQSDDDLSWLPELIPPPDPPPEVPPGQPDVTPSAGTAESGGPASSSGEPSAAASASAPE